MMQQPNSPAERQFSVQDANTIVQILEGTTVQGLKGAAELVGMINRFKTFVNSAIAGAQKGARKSRKR